MKAEKRGRIRRAVVAPILGVILLSGMEVIGAQPASAHARCDGQSHRDWHTSQFHNDYHYYWKKQGNVVYFKNNRHADHTYTIFC